jgi:RNA-splicing ligase RtcB
MEISNYSSEPDWKIRSWLPANLAPEKIVFFPDACPGRSPLPTGTASLLRRGDWRRFAVSDCGCGMRLLRSNRDVSALELKKWDAVARGLISNKGGLGDLGGGNHFLDALEPYNSKQLHFLIHTGSRNESGMVDNLVDQPEEFDREFSRVVAWAKDNRAAIQKTLEQVFGPLELVLDLPHNTYEEQLDGSVIIRKGAVKVKEGDLNVIPSHMAGDVMLVSSTAKVGTALSSLSHGTGRTVARSDSKSFADTYDFTELRRRVLMPSFLDNASLRTEGPYAYRNLDDCLSLISDFVKEVDRFSVVGYMGHL